MKIHTLFLLLFILSIFSCEKVIDLEVSETEQKVVIDANYQASLERVEVKLTKSKNVFESTNFPLVTGANIEIIDENGVATELIEQGDGIYELTNYTPVFNTTYSMKVTVDGETYEAADFLPSLVELDSLTQDFEEGSIFASEGYIVYMNFTDPSGDNYYRAVRTENGEKATDLGDQFIFDDQFSSGNQQSVPFFTERYDVDDTVSVEFRSYSKNSYDYYTQLFDIAGESGQSAAPANPDPSWTNGALGHFAAYGHDADTIIIKE
ncbi:MAG: DUF4249 domain-containing protein [Brumimicrobium sp.]